jgi:signal recognition particle receptor subunit beta
MVLFNHATREMTAKIVYYGPGLCGKTTNLMVIFDKLDPKNRGKMLSLATKTDRTLFFDLLPVDIGKVGAFNLKIQLYTVPGQVFYNETRKLVLKGADSIVFVADSQPSMVESNRESFANLIDNLNENSIDPNEIPVVVQYNKRDIPGVLPVDELQEKLGFEGYPYVEASAVLGDGVMETFKLVSKITAKHLINRLQGKPGSRSEPRSDAKKAEPKKITVRAPEAFRTLPPEPPPVEEAEPVDDSAAFTENTPPDPSAAVNANPFAESVPFDTAVDSGDYEKVEEVSLEQLLEGRERPATFAGNIAVPFIEEEVESLDEHEMIEPEAEVAVAVEEPPAVQVEQVSPAPETFVHDEALAGPMEGRLQMLEERLAELEQDQQKLYRVLADVAAQLQAVTRRNS